MENRKVINKNILLFAANYVGLEIIKYFKEKQGRITCLVLDHKNAQKLNGDIIAASGIKNQDSIIYSDSLYTPDTLWRLKTLDLDLAILCWWPYIIKKDIIGLPREGILNLHPSYLPYNRGKDPNFWSIVENSPYGVTIHFIDEDIDSGDIAFQSLIEKKWDDTGESLYKRAIDEIIKLFKDNYEIIVGGKIPRVPQNPRNVSYRMRKEIDQHSEINLDKSYRAGDLINILRARTFPPHPGAWFRNNNEKYQVRVTIEKIEKEETD